MGLGAYLNPMADVITQLQYAYGSGLNGAVTYSYGVPATDANNWWTNVAYNVYTSTVTVPTMPWRNPATATEGIMWGRVKDAKAGAYVDDATVTVAGASTVKTDGNGYYVATLVPATAAGSIHSITASKSGMLAQTISSAKAMAGDIVRYDLWLNVPKLVAFRTTTNTTVISWPSPTPGWNLQQRTNLNTTNWSAPAETVYDNGISRYIIVGPSADGRSFRLQGS